MAEGLSALAALRAEREAIAEVERKRGQPRAGWFSPGKDGKPVKVRFLNELDENAELYDPAFGTFYQSVEHQAPGVNGFKSQAMDTMKKDGRDWAQEQHEKDPKAGWKPRKFFYINVAVYDEEEGKVVAKIVRRNVANQFVADLIEEYENEHPEGITGTTYLIKRVGEGTQTQWRLKETKDTLDVSGVTPWDLAEHAVYYVPYEKQREFYMKNATLPEASKPKVSENFDSSSEGDSEASEEQWGW